MIPGKLDYAALAQTHRPTNMAVIAAEVRRLHSEGLTPIDISTALRLNISDVHDALNDHHHKGTDYDQSIAN